MPPSPPNGIFFFMHPHEFTGTSEERGAKLRRPEKDGEQHPQIGRTVRKSLPMKQIGAMVVG